ncbi:MAG: DNA polymerase-3 subunit gamma/tau [Pirellulaceae bacterium]
MEIDGASNRGIDEIRQLRSNVNIRPSRSRYKIYIIDEVHMLTSQAFNALLKTLEEPPEHVKFIFCTTDPEKIPITVLSRCQRFDFSPVESNSIMGRLQYIVEQEGVEADSEALHLLARRAAGSMRDSQSLLEQLLSYCGQKITVDDVHAMLGTAKGGSLGELAQVLANRDAAGAIAKLDEAVTEGVDVGQLAEQLLGYFRDMMAAVVGCDDELMLYSGPDEHDGLVSVGQELGLETILAILQVLDQTVTKMRQTVHVRTLVEIALVRICNLHNLALLPELIAQLQAGGPIAVSSAIRSQTSRTQTIRTQTSRTQTSRTVAGDSPTGGPPPTTQKPAVAEKPAVVEEPAVVEKPAVPRKPTGAAKPDLATAAEVAPESHPVVASAASPESPSEPAAPVQKKTIVAVETPAAHPPNVGGGKGITSENIESVWKQALTELGDIAADAAGRATSVAISAPNQLVVTFSAEYHKDTCERHRTRLEQALASVVGQVVRMQLQVKAAQKVPKLAPSNSVSRRKLQRDKEQDPFVQQAIELFEGEVIKVDMPRKPQ